MEIEVIQHWDVGSIKLKCSMKGNIKSQSIKGVSLYLVNNLLLIIPSIYLMNTLLQSNIKTEQVCTDFAILSSSSSADPLPVTLVETCVLPKPLLSF